jgi:hypothetical protein
VIWPFATLSTLVSEYAQCVDKDKIHSKAVGVVLVQYKARSSVLERESTSFWYSFD